MKKILTILILLVVLLTPMFASSLFGSSYEGVAKKDALSVGLNLGTNTGIGFRYGMGAFDLLANVGFDVFNLKPFTLAGDVAASYKVYTVDFGKGVKMPITVGGGISTKAIFADKFALDLSAIVPVGIEYTFKKVPITTYFRIAPALTILKSTKVDVGFDVEGFIGALWNF